MRKKHKLLRTGILVVSVLFVCYWIFVYFLVSMALVPSFMERLKSFERITKKSYAEQVQTSDISENRTAALDETAEWLKTVPWESREIRSKDGYLLDATLFLQEEEDPDNHQVAILLHGYTGRKEEMYPFAYEYYKRGYRVLTPDLRCQGASEGDFIGMGLTDSEDLMGWIALILEEDPHAEIVLHGQSMGAATALMGSAREDLPENVVAVISDSSYTDAYTMFGEKAKDWFHLPAFPLIDSMRLMLLLRGGYDLYDASALEAVKGSKVPTLFIHGKEDKMISVTQGLALYEAADCEKELLIIEGAGHGQPQDKDPDRYYGAVFSWIASAAEQCSKS